MSGFDLGLGRIDIFIVLSASALSFVLAYSFFARRAGRKMNNFLINSLVHEQDQYILFFDFDSKILLANKSFEELVGVPSKKLKGRILSDTVPDEEIISTFTQHNDDLISGKSSSIVYNSKIQNKNSSDWYQIEKRILSLDKSRSRYILTLASNVSDKKLVESRLSDTQSEYGQLVESASDIIFKADLNGNFNFVNSIVKETLGYSEFEFLSMNISDIVADEDKKKVESFYRNQLQEKIPGTYLEFRAKTKSGQIKWLGQSVTFIKEQENIVGFQSVTRDITAAKETESYLKRAKEIAEEANRTKNGFIASMSHEFRTPLNAILGYTQILKQSTTLAPDEKEQVQVIANSGEQLLSMVTDILELSKIDSDQSKLDTELVILEPFIEELTSSFVKKSVQKGLKFEIKPIGKPAEIIEADVNKIATILRNLLSNAVKYTSDGSIILKYSTKEHEGRYSLNFQIEDTGIGIKKDYQQHIFEPFWQSDNLKNYGTGLGLTLSKKLVEFLGGTITLESTSGKGTKVRVSVPIRTQQNLQTKVQGEGDGAISGQVQIGRNKLRVLVVDDLQANRTVTRILLQEKGFEIKEAENGQEAIDYLEHFDPHIILMDINMPVMDGIEATLTIRAIGGKFSEIPIIAITAGGFKTDKKELLAQGFSDYFLKPFNTDELIASIEQFIEMDSFRDKAEKDTADPEPEEVAEFIESLENSKSDKIITALKMQDLDSIVKLRDNPHFRENFENPNFSKLVDAAQNFDYLFITKVYKSLSDSNTITA